jgi:hypothetical protein
MDSHPMVEWTQLLFIFLSSWSNFFEGAFALDHNSLAPRISGAKLNLLSGQFIFDT